MSSDWIEANYLLETPLEPQKIAAVMAGEQSSGTFVAVAGETEELRERAAAVVKSVTLLDSREQPSLDSSYLKSKGISGPYNRAKVTIAYPCANVGKNLATLASTVSGNLFDIGEITGLKLLSIDMPHSYRRRYAMPKFGVAGTCAAVGVDNRPLFGTIVKPNVGMDSAQIASLVTSLCEAGVDFIKDDEVCANPDHAPVKERISLVMQAIRSYEQKAGRKVMMAFNISDEVDEMRRHAELIEREGGSCAMLSLNWCGLSAVESLHKSTPLALHGHRNGFGGMSRHPSLGLAFDAWHVLYRLAGIDHLHVHGIGGKFVDSKMEVTEAAQRCLLPVATDGPAEDSVMPVFSSGQWAGTLPDTLDAAAGADFMFLAGGGILAHPQGPAAGVKSLQQAYAAIQGGNTLEEAANQFPELASALSFYQSL